MILAFVLFWVVVGLAVVLIALRGGSARERTPGESRAGERLTLVGVTLLFAFGIAVPTLVLADNGAHKAANAPGGVTLTAEQQHGRYLFGQACNVCHTLAASEAHGHVGPNLDVLRPPEALVLNAIAMGRYRGNGNMPAELYTGVDAQAVASYVAAVAGH
jgi:mono/diheme cytochrome c family protein